MGYRLYKQTKNGKEKIILMEGTGSIEWESDSLKELGAALKKELKTELVPTIGLGDKPFIHTELERKQKNSKGKWVAALCVSCTAEDLVELYKHMT